MSKACSRQTAKPQCSLRGPATGWEISWRNAGYPGTASETCFAETTQRRLREPPMTSGPELRRLGCAIGTIDRIVSRDKSLLPT